jgi:hypothetical protein
LALYNADGVLYPAEPLTEEEQAQKDAYTGHKESALRKGQFLSLIILDTESARLVISTHAQFSQSWNTPGGSIILEVNILTFAVISSISC